MKKISSASLTEQNYPALAGYFIRRICYSTTMRLSTEQYIELMRTSPVTCVDIIFFDEQKENVLLFRRRNEPAKGVFFTPGGCIEKGEYFITAIKRKMYEELRLSIDESKLDGPYLIEELWPNSSFPGISYHAITIYFGYTLSQKEVEHITLDNQHDEAKWFAANDIMLHPNVITRIETSLKATRG